MVVLNDLITNAYVSLCKIITKQGMPRKRENAQNAKTKSNLFAFRVLSPQTKLNNCLNY